MIAETPIHWYGLPDLRDGSMDLKTWGLLPVERWLARTMLNLSPAAFRLIMRDGKIDMIDVMGRNRILLRGLPQTARCFFIEQVFMPESIKESQNYLYKQGQIRKALNGCTAKKIYWLVDSGQMVRELMPGGGFRYPHWGMEESLAIKVRDIHFQDQNNDLRRIQESKGPKQLGD